MAYYVLDNVDLDARNRISNQQDAEAEGRKLADASPGRTVYVIKVVGMYRRVTTEVLMGDHGMSDKEFQ